MFSVSKSSYFENVLARESYKVLAGSLVDYFEFLSLSPKRFSQSGKRKLQSQPSPACTAEPLVMPVVMSCRLFFFFFKADTICKRLLYSEFLNKR